MGEMMRPTEPMFLEDLTVGQTFRSGSVTVDPEKARAFAAEFDPQPFHLDEAAAAGSLFGGLVASGWHTAAITMRLLVESGFKPAGGIIGIGFDQCRWPRPVRPGDELHVESEVLEVRRSSSRPDQGWINVRIRTLNQDDIVVQVAVARLLVPCQPA
jgi:acyl dehydratase